MSLPGKRPYYPPSIRSSHGGIVAVAGELDPGNSLERDRLGIAAGYIDQTVAGAVNLAHAAGA
jgi:hypothetical protein